MVLRNSLKALDALLHPTAVFMLLMLMAVRAFAGSVALAWDPVSSPALAGYVVYYGPTAGSYTSKIDVGNTTVRTVPNLTDGGTYHFAVTAYDASHKETGFSNDVTITLPAGPPVANFTASTTTGFAPLAMNFINASTGSITTYAWNFGDGTTSTAKAPNHVYSAAGVYTVSLTVTGSGGNNTKTIPNYVSVKVATGSDSAPPTAPSTLTASASTTSNINLAWKASTDNVGVTSYRIERCLGAGCTSFAQIATASGTTYSNAGLVTGTSYSYRVRATDAAGNVSAYSNVSTATTYKSTPFTSATALSATPNPSTSGSIVTFTATVTGTAPTGSVSFTDNGVAMAGCAAASVTGSGNARTAVCSTSALAAGSHAIAATYSGDAANTKSSSATLNQVVNGTAGSINVALASNGGVSTASSVNSAGYAVAGVNDNKRSGAGWGSGGGWNDGTPSVFGDWVQIKFNGQKTIDHVVLYTLQDHYTSPVEPTDSMTFNVYGVTDFQVQAWNGAAWVTLGTVSGNNRVKRTVSFTPYTTDRIRVFITGSKDGIWSRVTEIEAWTSTAAPASTNFALASNGSVASASSIHDPGFSASGVIDNRRSGAGWGNGGGWNDGTPSVFGDWVQINFNGQKTIDRVVLYTVQDNYQSPVEPTDAMTFSRYGVTDFQVQGWNGTGWATLATVTGNRLVKRTVSFTSYKTDRIRIVINASADGVWSRITEIEAWGR